MWGLHGRESVSTGGPPDDKKEDYMDWLERMWDVQKFDVPGRSEREEARTEDVLNLFKDLGELAKRHVEPPTAPRWEALPERSLVGEDRHEQDRRELEAAGWERLERSDGKDVWLDPDNGFMYPQAVAVAMVREGSEADVSSDPEGTA
jgi:hypothetical protein